METSFLCSLPDELKDVISKYSQVMAEQMATTDYSVVRQHSDPNLQDRLPRKASEAYVRLLSSSGMVKTKAELSSIDYLSTVVDPRSALIGELVRDGVGIESGWISSSFKWHANSGMSWHTDFKNHPEFYGRDLRLYIFNNEGDDNEFRTYDPVTDKYSVHYEEKGWGARVFDITKPFWHCLIVNSPRVSFGTALRYVERSK